MTSQPLATFILGYKVHKGVSKQKQRGNNGLKPLNLHLGDVCSLENKVLPEPGCCAPILQKHGPQWHNTISVEGVNLHTNILSHCSSDNKMPTLSTWGTDCHNHHSYVYSPQCKSRQSPDITSALQTISVMLIPAYRLQLIQTNPSVENKGLTRGGCVSSPRGCH